MFSVYSIVLGLEKVCGFEFMVVVGFVFFRWFCHRFICVGQGVAFAFCGCWACFELAVFFFPVA